MSLLKKCIGVKNIPSATLSDTDEDGVFPVVPESGLATRMITRSQTEIPQVLVMWVNSTPEAATWEDWSFLRRKFKAFDPWGQGSSQEGGIVKDNMDLEGNV